MGHTHEVSKKGQQKKNVGISAKQNIYYLIIDYQSYNQCDRDQ